MINKEKKHHHFVPQVYLRKFAHKKEKKGNRDHFYVSSFDKIDNREEIKSDIENICFKTKLYTLESIDLKKRESIENFFANTIESDYNRFYDIITNDNLVDISQEERELIIFTIIHLHTRNHYWFKIINDSWTHHIKSYDFSDLINVYTENGEILFPFKTQSVEEIISDNP
jgi:hypothetical protein